ncbi:HAD family hydrolase [Marinicella sp. W31]|uniref:HAD family hydrolase n=1 Tax=Marinicella sp. W31 TaxID=3023713 RepID=UPI00375692A3
MNNNACKRNPKDTIIRSKHWIFDMDGTLTQHMHDFVGMRRQLGLPDDMMMLEAIDTLPEKEAADLHQKLERMELEYAEKAQPMPHIHDFLEILLNNNVRIGILTRNTLAVAQRTLEVCGLSHFFHPQYILDRRICPPKPSPAGILRLLEDWQAQPQDTVMVGDYLFDLEAGRNAGVHTVHIDTRGELTWPQHTDIRIGCFTQLLQCLN